MRIIPAIDIIDGKCVRLTQGDFGKKKIYREDPVEVALEFQNADLECLHLVDLDGAKKGKVVNWDVVREIQERTALSVDFGGGVKTEEEVEQLLDLGVHQINIGSMAVKEPEKFSEWLKKYGPEKLFLGADVKNEKIAVGGWLETTNISITDFIEENLREGIQQIFCTDISKDGLLQGPAIGLYKNLITKFPNMNLTASGGVSNAADLNELKQVGCSGAIVGKAIYEGKITMDELKAFIK